MSGIWILSELLRRRRRLRSDPLKVRRARAATITDKGMYALVRMPRETRTLFHIDAFASQPTFSRGKRVALVITQRACASECLASVIYIEHVALIYVSNRKMLMASEMDNAMTPDRCP